MIDFAYNPIIPADYKSQRERTSSRSLSLGRPFSVRVSSLPAAVPPGANERALRSGAEVPAEAGTPTLRSVRGMFPTRVSSGKMILFFPPPTAAETRKGLRPLPGPCPGRGDGGRGTPVGCLLLSRVPAIRLAAERHCRREGRGGGTRDGRRGNRERPGAVRRGGFYFFRPR